MTDWFRSWHGAPTDPKWLGIARRAGVAPGIAVAVGWALMDRASQAEERGSIEGYDADGLACFFGCEPEQVDAIVTAMTDKGMIAANRFSAWEKRQPKREDGASERAREWRERKRTQANANEPPDTETDKNSSLRSESASAPEPEMSSRKKPRTSLANSGWVPNFDDAADCGLTLPEAQREVPKFRDNHTAKGTLMADWNAGWRTWCRNTIAFRRDRGPSQPRASPPLRGTNAMLESLARHVQDDHDDQRSGQTLDLLPPKH